MPKFELDRIDRSILRTLQTEPNISNVALAERVGLSPSPCLRRVRRLRETGVIRATLTDIAPEAVGYPIQAVVRVQLSRHGLDESGAFEAAVRAMPDVISAYLVAGTTDFFLLAVAESLEAYSALVKRIGALPGLRDVESSIVLQTVKPWSPLPL